MLSNDKIEELKAKHGEIYKITSGDFEIVVRTPTRGEYKRFLSEAGDKKTRPDAIERIVRAAMVYPDHDTFGQWLEKKPGLCMEFCDEVQDICGVTGEAQSQKL